jgi:hypothetical protein
MFVEHECREEFAEYCEDFEDTFDQLREAKVDALRRLKDTSADHFEICVSWLEESKAALTALNVLTKTCRKRISEAPSKLRGYRYFSERIDDEVEEEAYKEESMGAWPPQFLRLCTVEDMVVLTEQLKDRQSLTDLLETECQSLTPFFQNKEIGGKDRPVEAWEYESLMELLKSRKADMGDLLTTIGISQEDFVQMRDRSVEEWSLITAPRYAPPRDRFGSPHSPSPRCVLPLCNGVKRKDLREAAKLLTFDGRTDFLDHGPGMRGWGDRYFALRAAERRCAEARYEMSRKKMNVPDEDSQSSFWSWLSGITHRCSLQLESRSHRLLGLEAERLSKDKSDAGIFLWLCYVQTSMGVYSGMLERDFLWRRDAAETGAFRRRRLEQGEKAGRNPRHWLKMIHWHDHGCSQQFGPWVPRRWEGKYAGQPRGSDRRSWLLEKKLSHRLCWWERMELMYFASEERYVKTLESFFKANPPQRLWERRPLILDIHGFREENDPRDQPYYDSFWERYVASSATTITGRTHRKKKSSGGGSSEGCDPGGRRQGNTMRPSQVRQAGQGLTTGALSAPCLGGPRDPVALAHLQTEVSKAKWNSRPTSQARWIRRVLKVYQPNTS